MLDTGAKQANMQRTAACYRQFDEAEMLSADVSQGSIELGSSYAL